MHIRILPIILCVSLIGCNQEHTGLWYYHYRYRVLEQDGVADTTYYPWAGGDVLDLHGESAIFIANEDTFDTLSYFVDEEQVISLYDSIGQVVNSTANSIALQDSLVLAFEKPPYTFAGPGVRYDVYKRLMPSEMPPDFDLGEMIWNKTWTVLIDSLGEDYLTFAFGNAGEDFYSTLHYKDSVYNIAFQPNVFNYKNHHFISVMGKKGDLSFYHFYLYGLKDKKVMAKLFVLPNQTIKMPMLDAIFIQRENLSDGELNQIRLGLSGEK